MRELDAVLEEVFLRQERLSRDEIYRRAVAAQAPTEVVSALDALPEGEYAQDEVAEALEQVAEPAEMPEAGVPANELDDDDLLRELAEVHRTRHDALRHGSDHALATHDHRMAELEGEYLRRFPQREVDPQRLREGARGRRVMPQDEIRTGADQPWEPRDFAIASGRDPTPENIEWARRVLEQEGPSAIERIVP
jgi:hypothetical protein